MSRHFSKNDVSGYGLFRQNVLERAKSERRHLSTHELKNESDRLWEALDEVEKKEWKSRAKEQKIKQRADAAAAHLNAEEMSADVGESTSAETHSVADVRAKSRRLHRPSKFQNLYDLNLVDDADKRRSKDRDSFEISFTWKYETKKDDLKVQKFHLLSANLLYTTPNTQYIPAEIGCVEFTLKDGVTRQYCVPVKLQNFNPRYPVNEEINDLAKLTHQFTLEDLQVLGRPCDEIAKRLIDMSHVREPNCQNIRFFILSNELMQTYGCWEYILHHSNVEERYKKMSVKDVALVDDLTFGLFKFFNVRYPKSDTRQDELDLPFLLDLVDGSQFRRIVCGEHDSYDEHAVCCLSKLHMIVEIIRDSVDKKRFDDVALTEFATRLDSCKRSYYVRPASLLGAEEEQPSSSSVVVRQRENVAPADENWDDETIENFHYHSTNVWLPDEMVEVAESVFPDDASETSTETLVVPSAEQQRPSSSVDKETYDQFSFSDSFTTIPNTLAVQHLLPSRCRGFGRGLGFTPEGQLLECVQRFGKRFVGVKK